MLIVRKRPTRLKLLCGVIVVVGLFICLIPTIFPSVDPKAEKTKDEAHGVSRVMWPIIFMLGFVSNHVPCSGGCIIIGERSVGVGCSPPPSSCNAARTGAREA